MCNLKELSFDIAEHCEPAVHELPEMLKCFLVGLEEGEV